MTWSASSAAKLALLERAKTQEEQIFYAFHLRNMSEGWTLPQRRAYFEWLNRAQERGYTFAQGG